MPLASWEILDSEVEEKYQDQLNMGMAYMRHTIGYPDELMKVVNRCYKRSKLTDMEYIEMLPLNN